MRNKSRRQRLRCPDQSRTGGPCLAGQEPCRELLADLCQLWQYGDPDSVSPLCGTWITLYQLEKDAMIRATGQPPGFRSSQHENKTTERTPDHPDDSSQSKASLLI